MTASPPPSAILSSRSAEEGASEQSTSEMGMPARGAKGVQAQRRGPVLLARRGRCWDVQEVAEHLMSRRGQMVCGLKRKTPWAGLDADTLDSCFGHAAAVIARVAASGQRPEWRRAKDLEKAQIAAFRHQALDHWKRINARSRQGDRLAVAFDPERHASPDTPMDRLFEQPDLHAIQRDLLAELADPELRAFWDVVLGEAGSFKAAGDRLGLTKAQVMARTRAGRFTFASYLDRRETGELCQKRGEDIAALRAGTTHGLRAERAEAHLESCYACSLIHEPNTGAFERGILGVAPIGLVLRLVTRAGEVASVPATRWTEAGAGARLVGGAIAALTVAGSGLGIEAATRDRPITRESRPSGKQQAPAVVREDFRTPALSPPRSAPPTAASRRVPKRRTVAKRTAKKRPRARKAVPATARTPSAPTNEPAASEFSFERGSIPAAPTAPVAPPPATPQTSPPATEFSNP